MKAIKDASSLFRSTTLPRSLTPNFSLAHPVRLTIRYVACLFSISDKGHVNKTVIQNIKQLYFTFK